MGQLPQRKLPLSPTLYPAIESQKNVTSIMHTVINHNSTRHSRESGNPEIPPQAGWIPPYQVRGKLVKPGMTNYIRLMWSCIITPLARREGKIRKTIGPLGKSRLRIFYDAHQKRIGTQEISVENCG